MKPDKKQELLKTLDAIIRKRLGTGPLRVADVSDDLVRDYAEVWKSVADTFALEKLRSTIASEIGRLSKRSEDLQIPLPGFELPGYDNVPLLIATRKAWAPTNQFALPELEALVDRLAESLKAKPSDPDRKARQKEEIKERKRVLAETRELVRLVRYFNRSTPGILVADALARKPEYDAMRAAKKAGGQARARGKTSEQQRAAIKARWGKDRPTKNQ